MCAMPLGGLYVVECLHNDRLSPTLSKGVVSAACGRDASTIKQVVTAI